MGDPGLEARLGDDALVVGVDFGQSQTLPGPVRSKERGQREPKRPLSNETDRLR
jgi:hypothetical protein